MTEIRESSIEEQIAKWLYLDRFQNPKTAPAWENMPLFAKRTWEDKAKAILAIPEIKEGQELLEKAKSEKPELDEFLSQELDSTNMEYQRRIAHLLWYADGMGAYGNSHGELAVIRPETGEIVMRERDIPLASGESR
ncbi:hypothetical protein LCGC14_1649200 [marine sediment metagenome]|uniref:Uncharacterized protein n=1 Tax=marine sediment metagenome TaxID=412755 RepID=A0A0F9HXC1_9ZZZZ